MRYTVVVLAVVFVMLLMVSCNPKPDNYVVATVNGQQILLGDVMKSKQFQAVVMEEVNKRKFQEWARIKNIKVDDNKVNAKYAEERNKYGSDKEWEDFLKVRGFTPESAKKMLADMELQYAIALSKAEPITDATIEKNWKDQKSWWQSIIANDIKATKNLTKDPKSIEFAEAKDYIKRMLEEQTAQSEFPKAMEEINEYFSGEGKIVLNYLPIEERLQLAREEKEARDAAKKQQRDMERRQEQVVNRGEDIKAETGGAKDETDNPPAETKTNDKKQTKSK